MKTAMRQAIFSGGFFAGTVTIIVVLAFSCVQAVADAFALPEVVLQSGFHAEIILNALVSDAMTMAIPIAAALPFTASFVDEAKNGYIKQYLPRTTIKRYISSKLVANAVAGGLVLFVGIAAAYIISAIIFTPFELVADEQAQPYLANLISSSFLMFFAGGLWATVGLALASETGSKYMAFASPFIIYYVLIILNERYFEDLWVLYPKEWILPGDYWVMGTFGVILVLLEITAVAGMGFVFAAKRRIERL